MLILGGVTIITQQLIAGRGSDQVLHQVADPPLPQPFQIAPGALSVGTPHRDGSMGRLVYLFTKHFRYLKCRNPHLYKLYIRLM